MEEIQKTISSAWAMKRANPAMGMLMRPALLSAVGGPGKPSMDIGGGELGEGDGEGQDCTSMDPSSNASNMRIVMKLLFEGPSSSFWPHSSSKERTSAVLGRGAKKKSLTR